MSLSKDLDDGFLFILIVGIIMFFSYVIFLKEYLRVFEVILIFTVVLLIYFGFGKDIWKSKFRSNWIVGNNLKNCFLPQKIIKIDDIIPNHFIIFLGSYEEQSIGRKVIGDDGALVIDGNYFWRYDNNNIAISPDVVPKIQYYSDKSNYNDIVRVISKYGGNKNKIYMAIPHNAKITINDLTQKEKYKLTLSNISSYINSLMHERDYERSKNESFGSNVQDTLQYMENTLKTKKWWQSSLGKKKGKEIKEDDEN